jgi:hypothetical protein
MLKNIFLLVMVLLSINVYSYTIIAPPGYSGAGTASGWEIWKKSQNGGTVYVQKIDVRQRAVTFVNNPKVGDTFPTFTIRNKFASFNSAFSMTNAAFFDNAKDGSGIGLSFPYRPSALLSKGWSTAGNESNIRVLSIGVIPPFSVNRAMVIPYSSDLLTSTVHRYFVAGLSPYATSGKRPTQRIGRTFIGVKDNHFLYILNGDKLTTNEARLNLMDFGLYDSDIVHFDGSASTQLSFKNSSGVITNFIGCEGDDPDSPRPPCTATRNIPQGILVM